jgi:hypothetical protein
VNKMSEKEIRQKLYDIRIRGRERYLKLMGVDLQKVRELEKSVDSEYQELAKAVERNLKESGKERAHVHRGSFERAISIFNKDLQAVLDHPSRADLSKVVYCPCVYPFTASPAPPPQDSVILDPPTGGGASGSVTYNSADNIAHPKADTGWGQGTGTINSSTVKTSFRFSFMPTADRSYCIRPVVYMNGHWQVWTWGTCSGLTEDLGSGVAKVVLRVRVDQLSLPVAQKEHVVFEQTASGGVDIESGFGYDSEVDGGASLVATLQGGHEAVAWVECESYAQISNHGRAWVDMQTSPFFYFWVPEVRWGWRSCFPWFPLFTATETE